MLVGDNAIPIGTSLLTIRAQGDEGTHSYRVRMVFDETKALFRIAKKNWARRINVF